MRCKQFRARLACWAQDAMEKLRENSPVPRSIFYFRLMQNGGRPATGEADHLNIYCHLFYYYYFLILSAPGHRGVHHWQGQGTDHQPVKRSMKVPNAAHRGISTYLAIVRGIIGGFRVLTTGLSDAFQRCLQLHTGGSQRTWPSWGASLAGSGCGATTSPPYLWTG